MPAPDPVDQPPAALAVIILAAGQGSRLRSRIPKPLHRVGGRPLVDHVLRAAAALRPAQTVVVTGHGAAELRRYLELDGGDDASAAGHGPPIEAHQAEQLGTAHAVGVALPALRDDIATVVVLYADTPLVTARTLLDLAAARADSGVPLALVTCQAPDPTGYGRIVRDGDGRLAAIVEEQAATEAVKAIAEINAGIYAFDATWLRGMLPRVERGPAGEYYLPDLVTLAIDAAEPAGPWPVVTIGADFGEALGINDRVQLAQAEALLRARTLRRLMLSGVTIVDPATTYIDERVAIGRDTVVLPLTTIRGATTIGADCEIGPQAIVDDCVIGDGCRVIASTLEGSTMAAGSAIGPYSHLRPGAALGPGVHVGNFAEIKNASVGAGSAVGHVSYLGDAAIGERVNIGAGTITANYDGARKHRTVIGDGAFIGCDTILRAPIEVGAGARTGAGAVVTHDVPAGETVAGVPARPLPKK